MCQSIQTAPLPFVTMERELITSWWTVSPSGNWSDDNASGRHFAEMLIAEMRVTQNPLLLKHVVQSMCEQKTRSGIEVGFLHQIAELAMR
jgi:D-tyrosyl-tRNA(Tyr) deacylase